MKHLGCLNVKHTNFITTIIYPLRGQHEELRPCMDRIFVERSDVYYISAPPIILTINNKPNLARNSL
jgi:hypothetical protein